MPPRKRTATKRPATGATAPGAVDLDEGGRVLVDDGGRPIVDGSSLTPAEEPSTGADD